MEDQLIVNMNEYLPLRDVVFQTLRQAILKGELKPGERLMEIKLAKRLGVSRTPIREAIRMLELEGLVVMIPRRGAAVAKITKKDLEDVLEVRCALEELAVSLACERINEDGILKLEDALSEFELAIQHGDVTSLAEKDVAFHDIIFESTGNARLIQLLNNLREQMYRYRLEYLKDNRSHDKLVLEHRIIIETLMNRDVLNAQKRIREHIYNQVMNVSQQIDSEEE
ncbi:GntR family transcriptional regulator [Anaeromicropila populeti]|uniref:Transcriptional regulator, GntR family n=1 Tax=Anaeromicropila populeti TaxID=37658 RepID=A0A1I6I6B1_9FIRM|nr:GntR family transcriptional regulator [Anaeromicropila populeti]SFR62194.1 transcriptional regulator, GntR family [Anaeromicropila populeti]